MTDDELMALVAKGDQSAFRKLFDRHSAKVYGYARKILGEPARAEDVSQEVWMKVVHAAPAFQSRSQFVPWILTMVRNAAFNSLRKTQNTREEYLEDGEDFPEGAAEISRKTVEDVLVETNDKELIRQKLDELPEVQRVLLVTWMTEDLSYEELARQSGKTVTAVKSLLFRAKRNLEKSLKVVR